ncbi:hypothetical protein FBQ85_26030 [Cytophagia bacterium CHB2]|nr:hypothetical protein [Cytophagia bacterium CHB2]
MAENTSRGLKVQAQSLRKLKSELFETGVKGTNREKLHSLGSSLFWLFIEVDLPEGLRFST